MINIDVIDNGGQWTHREWRVLKYLGINSKIIANNIDPRKIDADALVLSGGASSVSFEGHNAGKLDEYLQMDIPILGICFGMQFISKYFNGKCGSAEIPEYGKSQINILKEDCIFKNIPYQFNAWENHSDEVKETELDILASSDNCKIQTVKHSVLPIYGVQFHPEVEHTEYGVDIFKNFIDIVKEYKISVGSKQNKDMFF